MDKGESRGGGRTDDVTGHTFEKVETKEDAAELLGVQRQALFVLAARSVA